jgi:hypothetical protein
MFSSSCRPPKTQFHSDSFQNLGLPRLAARVKLRIGILRGSF